LRQINMRASRQPAPPLSAWSHAFYDSGLAEGASGLLLYTVFQMRCRA
jgi:hypothetical protein